MIEREILEEICEQYNIDCDSLVRTNQNILTYGEKEDIVEVLEFLKKELNIESKNVEKCPSILFFGIENIKINYKFLQEKGIERDNIETCLHILSTEMTELKRTYEYVQSNYGIEYISSFYIYGFRIDILWWMWSND